MAAEMQTREAFMATAIFHQDFHYSRLVPPIGWVVKAAEGPQVFPRDLIDAAVKAGAATLVKEPVVKAPVGKKPRQDAASAT